MVLTLPSTPTPQTTLFQACYGISHIKPKHHWLLDTADQILADGIVCDALIIERNHLMIKKVSTHILSTQRFEMSLMSGIVNNMYSRAADAVLGDRLLPPSETVASGAKIADSMDVVSVIVSRGDMVYRPSDVGLIGMVVACCESAGALFGIVRPTTMTKRISEQAAEYKLHDNLEYWPGPDLRICLAWQFVDDIAMVVRR